MSARALSTPGARWVWDWGLGVSRLRFGFRVLGFWFSGFRDWGMGFWVWRFGLLGFGFRVLDSRFLFLVDIRRGRISKLNLFKKHIVQEEEEEEFDFDRPQRR